MRAIGTALIGVVLLFANEAEAGGWKNFPLHSSPRDMPTIKFVDEGANALTLEHWQGKIVLLNIWATWCPPCRKEMPTLDRLKAELGGDRFDVVALSIDRAGVPAVRRFYDQIGVKDLTLYVDPTMKAQRQLKLFGLPGTLLLGSDGKELGRLLGPAEWDSPEMIAGFTDIIRNTFDER